MSDKSHFEAIIAVSGRREGRRYYEDHPLNVPVDLAAGRYERLSNLALREAITDLRAEQARRCTKDSSALVVTMQGADLIAAELAVLVRSLRREAAA